MENIIRQLCYYNQYLLKIIFDLLKFISKHIPLKQWMHDDSASPKYQKFKTDKLPIIIKNEKQDYRFLLEYYKWRYEKPVTPVRRRKPTSIPENTVCPRCSAPLPYLYDNNGGHGECQCKVCGQTFVSGKKASASLRLLCPYCSHALVGIKDRKHFVIHKCVNEKCSYYRNNLKKIPKDLPIAERAKHKLHYLYREFTVDFFKMDMNSLPENASSLKFRKESAHIMGLCLTYSVNLGLSLRKTALALKEIHGVDVSHTMVANYLKTAACVVKPFVDNYDYARSETFIADETYIKVKGVKGFIWFIMDAVSRAVIGYRVSDNRGVGACILAMRMAFGKLKRLPDNFRFIADGYSAYPLAAQQFALKENDPLKFDITQVIGLTNEDAVSKQFRPFKEIVERLNRTFKASYRHTCGYDNFDGANYSVALWVAYYNFLRPHSRFNHMPLVHFPPLDRASLMQDKWLLLIFYGQLTCQNLAC